jgi:hypothetical protein
MGDFFTNSTGRPDDGTFIVLYICVPTYISTYINVTISVFKKLAIGTLHKSFYSARLPTIEKTAPEYFSNVHSKKHIPVSLTRIQLDLDKARMHFVATGSRSPVLRWCPG